MPTSASSSDIFSWTHVLEGAILWPVYRVWEEGGGGRVWESERICDDLETWLLINPSRRGGGGRTFQPNLYSTPPHHSHSIPTNFPIVSSAFFYLALFFPASFLLLLLLCFATTSTFCICLFNILLFWILLSCFFFPVLLSCILFVPASLPLHSSVLHISLCPLYRGVNALAVTGLAFMRRLRWFDKLIWSIVFYSKECACGFQVCENLTWYCKYIRFDWLWDFFSDEPYTCDYIFEHFPLFD